MAAPSPREQVVTKVIESVQFSFYTDEEVRASSVKNITSPILFDNMNRPASEGLYDPALGPVDQYGSCITCGEPAVHCPGHCGRIELVLPVYNPLVFRAVAKLMNQVCIFCHHFKLEAEKIEKYAEMLELILTGDVIGAKSLESAKLGGELSSENSKKQHPVHHKNKQTQIPLPCERQPWTSLQFIEVKGVLNMMMSEMKGKKCKNCGARVPQVRSPSFGRLYQVGLSKGEVNANALKGLRLDLVSLFGAQSQSSDMVLDGDNLEELYPSSGLSEKHTMIDDVIDPSEAEQSDTILEESQRNRGQKKRQKKSNTNANFGSMKDEETCSKDRFLTPLEVKEHLRLLWEKESRICSLIWDIQQVRKKSLGKSASHSMFFLQALLVPPNKFRPPNKMSNALLEHPQNILYGKVLQSNIALAEAIKADKTDSQLFSVVEATNKWLHLQDCVNILLDSSTVNSLAGKNNTGIRQLLEKKEGLFRQNMMGKRVNFACRSVISPDPYIAVNEIGIPPYFATRLTYPEKVTHWNVEKLRQAIRNGASVYPGATHFEDEQGIISLASLLKYQRNSIAKRLLSTPGAATSGGSAQNIESAKVEGKTVYRHLQDGDILLVNRQPTLHKPSMMAHVARVLKGEKTIRMHYANCSTYNADFDGDEMNVHFPQDEISRAEAYNIVNANEQYIVPTSGDPIRGLIQDHVASATLLTKRDTFLTKDDYQHLVYSACVSTTAPVFQRGKSCPKIGIVKDDHTFLSLPPAIWKPQPLWTGKQVITALLNYVTRGSPPFTMKKAGRVPGDYWGKSSGELKVIIQNNELICGVLDKAQFGKYGLVHIVQELYGADAAGHLLSVFSRLFTGYLQMHGFTCGVADLLLVPQAEDYREKKLGKAEMLGDTVHSQFIGVDGDCIDLEQMEGDIEKHLRGKGEVASNRLDRLMSSALNRVTSEVNNVLFPKGLLKPFPSNCLSLMTVTGAKGGLVNFTQISSLLGQQELEGKRVPRMVSGKTLPCFPPWDSRARAGGFISDRFLTGLRPQEYYFHCMAGRDGLVDTAIKTSRSGYLQRCLIKNLECLKVHYDYTVRDSDGSVIQFTYGEDGLDVMKTSCLTEFKVLAANQKLVSRRLGGGNFTELNCQYSDKKSSDSYIKSLPEAFENKLQTFINGLSKKKKRSLKLRKQNKFLNLMRLKYISSLAQPGEPVGVIAGQSIGEPSTQMTLNTFHFAGRGEMNVTLGIPRLREILMTASKKILTPIMTCPLHRGKTREDAERLAAKLRRIRFADLVESLDVGIVPFSVQNGQVQTLYKLKIKLYPPESYPPYSNLTMEDCEKVFREQFIPSLMKEVERAQKKKGGQDAIQIISESRSVEVPGETNEDESQGNLKSGEQTEDEDEREEESEDEGADAQKRKAQGTDEMDYDDEIDENETSTVEDLYSEKSPLEEEDNDDNHSDVHNEAVEDEEINEKKFSKSIDTQKPSNSTEKKPKKKKKIEASTAITEGSMFEVQFAATKNTHILLPQIAENVAKKVFVRSVSNIDRCSVIDYNGDPNVQALQTDGINFQVLWMLGDELDLSKLTTNDINAMHEVYGVESARATIVREVKGVFDSYGISVNNHHLSLIADFMTFNGGYRPMNRIGIGSSTSPFLKMSFETATKFLVESCLDGGTDYLESPSSQVVVGQVAKVGTGCFDILHNLAVS